MFHPEEERKATICGILFAPLGEKSDSTMSLTKESELAELHRRLKSRKTSISDPSTSTRQRIERSRNSPILQISLEKETRSDT